MHFCYIIISFLFGILATRLWRFLREKRIKREENGNFRVDKSTKKESVVEEQDCHPGVKNLITMEILDTVLIKGDVVYKTKCSCGTIIFLLRQNVNIEYCRRCPECQNKIGLQYPSPLTPRSRCVVCGNESIDMKQLNLNGAPVCKYCNGCNERNLLK